MSLPNSRGVERTVILSGGEVTVRGLTIGEVRTVRNLSADKADRLAIQFATSLPAPEVEAWFDQALAGDLVRLVGAIFDASGMNEDATFPGPTGNDAGDAPPTE